MSVIGNLRSKQSLLQRIIKVSTTESEESYKFFSIVLVVIFTSVSLILLSTGASHINAIPWDVLLLLDAGWRILNGQIPHTDYYNPIGPLTYLLTALGMKVAQPSVSSIVYGNLLLFIVLTPWTWLIVRSRFSAAIAFLSVLFIGFLLIAPRALGFDVRDTTYAMLYNRQGFALLSILLVELFVCVRASVRPKFFLSGLTSGLLLALLLFCKINYFGIGAVAVLIHIVLIRCSLMWFIAFVSGFIFICIGMQAFFNISLPSYISDISLASHAQSISGRWTMLKQSFQLNMSYIYLIFLPLLFSLINLSKNKARKDSFWQNIKVWMITSFVIASGLLICAGNSQNGQDIPLLFIAGVIVLEYLRRELKVCDPSRSDLSETNYLLAVLIIIPFLYGSILLKDMESVAYSVAWHKVKLPYVADSQRFQSASLYSFVIPEKSNAITVYWKAKEVPDKINDGLTLLRRNLSNNSRIFSMSYVNPFPFSLQLPSPKGAALWWDINLSFNKEFFPQAETIFKDTDLVMIPKISSQDPGCCIDTVGLMKELYGDYLKTHFIEKDHSEVWTLLAKR